VKKKTSSPDDSSSCRLSAYLRYDSLRKARLAPLHITGLREIDVPAVMPCRLRKLQFLEPQEKTFGRFQV